jgi:hypothetical protein
MVLAACNARPEQARLREFLAVLGQGFLRGGESAALGRPTAPLAKLLAPLPRLLEPRGGTVRFRSTAVGARPVRGGWAVEIAGGERFETPHLVCALPARAARRLFEPALAGTLGLEAEARRPLSPIVSVLLWSRHPLLPASLLAFGPERDGTQARFHWGFQDRVESGYRACLVASAASGLASQAPAAISAQLPAFLAGRGLPAHFERARVLREPSPTPVFLPGAGPRL